MKECGTEGLNGDGPLSFQDVVKDKVPEYESFAKPLTDFLSKVQRTESFEVASKLASAGAQVKAMQLRVEVCQDIGVDLDWAKKAQPFPVVQGELNDYILDHAFLTDELYNNEYIADDLDKITRVVEKGTVALCATIPRPMEVVNAKFSEPDEKWIVRPKDWEQNVPIALPGDLQCDVNRVYLLDSGTSNNVFNGSFAGSHLRRLVRKLEDEMGFMTANDVMVTKHGVRAQIAAWDRVSDYI